MNLPGNQTGKTDSANTGRVTYGELARLGIFVTLMVLSAPLLKAKAWQEWLGFQDDSWMPWLLIAAWALAAWIVTYLIWGLAVKVFGKRT